MTDPMCALFLPVRTGGNYAPPQTPPAPICREQKQDLKQERAAMPTEKEIDEAKTEAGGWTRETLAAWGVPWPPPKDWKKNLELAAARSVNHPG